MIGFIFSKLASLTKFRIPTVLGLGLVILGIGSGVFLVIQNQTLTAKAGTDQTPKNITVSNLEDTRTTISWQTDTPTTGFVTYGINSSDEYTALDDRDGKLPRNHYSHIVTLTSLTPQTSYNFKIISGKTSSEVQKFTSLQTLKQNRFKPIVGTVVAQQQPLDDGLAHLSITGAVQSSIVKNGNFLIPISTLDIQNDTIGKLTIVSNPGTATALIRLADVTGPIGPIKLGDNLDLTVNYTPTPSPTSAPDPMLLKYDLSGDGLINSSDYSIALRNFGKSPQNKRADLNSDGMVDQKDLSEMSKKINELRR